MDIAAIGVVEDAKEGRYDALVERLRNSEIPITPEERNFIADLLEGKIRRPAHRQKSWRLIYDQIEIARYVQYLEGSYPPGFMQEAFGHESPNYPNKAAVSIAAEQFGVSESTVRGAVRAARKHSPKMFPARKKVAGG